MKLPWVSREMYEEMRASRDYERERGNAYRRDFIDSLMPETPEVQSVTVLRDPVQSVIREQATQSGREDHSLAMHLRTYARQLKRDGKSDDEIVGALVHWQTSDEISWQS